MLNRRLLILFNSFAGNGKPIRYKPYIEQTFLHAGLHFDSHIPESIVHFDAFITQALDLNYSDIILVGGDGTLHRAVNILMEQPPAIRSNISLGLISLGTGNDWIRTYHPTLTLEENLSFIIQGHHVFQDIGKITAPNMVRYFNNMAGFGFSGLVVDHSIVLKKLGKLSYLLGSIRTLFGFRSMPVNISGPSFKLSLPLFALFAGIGQYAGGNMKLCPAANPADGQFHLTLIPDQSFLKLIQLIPKLLSGRLDESPHIHVIKTPEIFIETSAPFIIPSEADGEAHQSIHYHVQILPKAVRFIV